MLSPKSGLKDLGSGLSDVPMEICLAQALGGNRRQKATCSPPPSRDTVGALLSPPPRARAAARRSPRPTRPTSPVAAAAPVPAAPAAAAAGQGATAAKAALDDSAVGAAACHAWSPEGRPRSPLPPQRRHLRAPDATFDGCVYCDTSSKNRFRVYPENRSYRTSSPLTWKPASNDEIKEMNELGNRLVGPNGMVMTTKRRVSPERVVTGDQVALAVDGAEPPPAPSHGPKSELLFFVGEKTQTFKALRNVDRQALAGDDKKGQEVDAVLPTHTAVRPGATPLTSDGTAASAPPRSLGKSSSAGLPAGVHSARVDTLYDASSKRFDFFKARPVLESVRATRRLADGLRPENSWSPPVTASPVELPATAVEAPAAPASTRTAAGEATPKEAADADASPARAKGRGPREPQNQKEGLVMLPAGRDRRLTWAPSTTPARTNKRGDFNELRSPPAVSPPRRSPGSSPRAVEAVAIKVAEASGRTGAAPRFAMSRSAEVLEAKPAEAAGRKIAWGSVGNLDAVSTAAPSPAASPFMSPHMSRRGSEGEEDFGASPLGEASRLRDMEARWKSPKSPRASRSFRH